MGKIKQILLIAVFLAGGMACFAKQLSIQIVQHNGSEEDVNEQSYIIEDELLNGFFDKGFIVTNSQASVSSSKADDEKLWKFGLNEALEGYSDYFVQIKLYYTGEFEGSGKYSGLEKVEWTISPVKTSGKLKKDSFDKLNKLNRSEELKSISYDLIAEIYKVVK